MAQSFSSVKSRAIGVTPTAVGGFTVPAATQTTVIGLTVANVTTTNVKVTVDIWDGVNATHILKNADLIVGQAHSLIGGDQKVVLNVGESIRVTSDTAASIDAILSKLDLA